MARQLLKFGRGQTITLGGKRLYIVSGRGEAEYRAGKGERPAKVTGRRKSLTRKPQ